MRGGHLPSSGSEYVKSAVYNKVRCSRYICMYTR